MFFKSWNPSTKPVSSTQKKHLPTPTTGTTRGSSSAELLDSLMFQFSIPRSFHVVKSSVKSSVSRDVNEWNDPWNWDHFKRTFKSSSNIIWTWCSHEWLWRYGLWMTHLIGKHLQNAPNNMVSWGEPHQAQNHPKRCLENGCTKQRT